MNLYQAGYFREGKQGSNAGWKIVSPSEGMSQVAKDGFKGIAANLTELKKTWTMPVTNLGIFLYDRFVYLMHVNYGAAGEDARGVTYVHGYCFNLSDYYELCRNPEMIFGITDHNFVLDYDASVSAYPVKESLSYEPLNFIELLNKYGFTDQEYKELILGAICALEGYSNPMCIKLGIPLDGYKQACREITYLIMMGLPYHLRMKMSFFSFKGKNTAIYYSDVTEGNNYADLESRKFSCDISRLKTLHFTRIYNTYPASDYQNREKIFQIIAAFISETVNSPLKDAGCAQIEAGFQGKIKKNDDEGILPDTAPELLAAFIRFDLKETDTVYQYLADLLKVINGCNLEITDSRIINRLNNRYDRSKNDDFKREVSNLSVRNILSGNKEEGFTKLWGLFQNNKEQYEQVSCELKIKDPDYFEEYYNICFLPNYLTDLLKIEEYIKEEQKIEKEGDTILSILLKISEREIKKAGSFSRMSQIEKQASKILERYPQQMNNVKNVKQRIYFTLWNSFDMDQFDKEETENYRDCEVEKLAEEGFRGRECENAQNICKLIDLLNGSSEEDNKFLYQLFMTDEIFSSIKTKTALQKKLRIDYTKRYDLSTVTGFDVSLALHYDCQNKCFKTLSWGSKMFKYFAPEQIRKMVRYSYVLADPSIKKQFIESLEKDIRENKSGPRVLIGGLKGYYDCLTGKKVKDPYAADGKADVAYVIQRILVGFFGMAAIAVCAISMSRYAGINNKWVPAIYAGVFAILFLLISIGKAAVNGGIGNLLEKSGVDGFVSLMIYIFLIVILLTAAVFIYLACGFLQKAIALCVFATLGVISAFVYGIISGK